MVPASLHLAHLRWFVQGRVIAPHPPTLLQLSAATAIIAAGLGAAAFVSARLRSLDDELDAHLAPFAKWARTVLGVAVGTSLIFAFCAGYVVSPDHPTHARLWLLIEFYAGASWLLGFLTPLGCLLVVALYVPLVQQGGPLGVLEHMDLLGAALFLGLGGRGPWSMDSLLDLRRRSPDLDADARHRVFEVLVGLSLAVVGCTEKLFDLGLARAFLAQYHWNALAVLHVSDDWFITLIGASEVLIGLLLVCNLMARVTVTMVLGVMTLTALLLGPREVTGHLFALGLVACVWLRPRRVAAGTRLAVLLEDERLRQAEVA